VLELQGVSGIDWGPETGTPPEMRTLRVEPPKRKLKGGVPNKDESHPPGEAGG